MNGFFVICDKCNAKIFKYKKMEETHPGFYQFQIECGCGYKFFHKMMTQVAKKAFEDAQKDKAKEMMGSLLNRIRRD